MKSCKPGCQGLRATIEGFEKTAYGNPPASQHKPLPANRPTVHPTSPPTGCSQGDPSAGPPFSLTGAGGGDHSRSGGPRRRCRRAACRSRLIGRPGCLKCPFKIVMRTSGGTDDLFESGCVPRRRSSGRPPFGGRRVARLVEGGVVEGATRPVAPS
jgi:hypothetical protein